MVVIHDFALDACGDHILCLGDVRSIKSGDDDSFHDRIAFVDGKTSSERKKGRKKELLS